MPEMESDHKGHAHSAGKHLRLSEALSKGQYMIFFGNDDADQDVIPQAHLPCSQSGTGQNFCLPERTVQCRAGK